MMYCSIGPRRDTIVERNMLLFRAGHRVGIKYCDYLGTKVSFALNKNFLVCAKWLLHSTVAGLASSPFPFQDRNGGVTVECSIHFACIQCKTHSAPRGYAVSLSKLKLSCALEPIEGSFCP